MSGSQPQHNPQQDVWLRVYDMAESNWWSSYLGVGIFHSGVEVHDIEWAYGGHEYDVSGIFASAPGDAPGPVTFRERIWIGTTSKDPEEVHELVQAMGMAFQGNSYHLLQRNCNTFSTDLCKKLTGQEAPAWVNRLAFIASRVHCLLPPTWVPIEMSPPAMSPTAAREREEDQYRKPLTMSQPAQKDMTMLEA